MNFSSSQGKEINKVIFLWIGFSALICIISALVILFSSISLMNSKTDEIKDDVSREMASYYSKALDSVVGWIYTVPTVRIGSDLWDEDAQIDREETISRMLDLFARATAAEAAVFIVDGEPLIESMKEDASLKSYPESAKSEIEILENHYKENDVVIALSKATDYPTFGNRQFIYTVVDVTDQAETLSALYEDGKGNLFKSQIAIAALFLLISIVLAPIGISWAIGRYITNKIVELDSMSQKIMEGSYDGEVHVDENSSFADIQKLLKGGQDILKEIG